MEFDIHPACEASCEARGPSCVAFNVGISSWGVFCQAPPCVEFLSQGGNAYLGFLADPSSFHWSFFIGRSLSWLLVAPQEPLDPISRSSLPFAKVYPFGMVVVILVPTRGGLKRSLGQTKGLDRWVKPYNRLISLCFCVFCCFTFCVFFSNWASLKRIQTAACSSSYVFF